MKRILSEFRLYVCNHWIAFFPSHRVRLWFYRKVMHFKIGAGSYIFMGCTFDCTENFVLGKNSVINANCRIDTRGGISIGENVSISNEVTILSSDHDMNTSDLAGRNRSVSIEAYSWIGTRAMILPGVIVGSGSIVAAGAVVTRNVGPYDVVAGVPAKIISRRPVEGNYTYTASFKRLFQ